MTRKIYINQLFILEFGTVYCILNIVVVIENVTTSYKGYGRYGKIPYRVPYVTVRYGADHAIIRKILYST